jgi:hypothetical protein
LVVLDQEDLQGVEEPQEHKVLREQQVLKVLREQRDIQGLKVR